MILSTLLACSTGLFPANKDNRGNDPIGPNPGGDTAAETETTVPPPVDVDYEPSVRRLSATEYARTIADLVGEVDGLEGTLPPDSTELGYDRIAQSQSVSELHIEGWYVASQEVYEAVVADPVVFEEVLGCERDLFPSSSRPVISEVPGDELTCSWDCVEGYCDAGGDSAQGLYYSSGPREMSSTFEFPSDGLYAIHLDAWIDPNDAGVDPTTQVEISLDGAFIETVTVDAEGGPARVTLEVEVTAGTHIVELHVPDSLYGVKVVCFQSLSIEGPVDLDAESLAGPREECVQGWVDSWVPRMWRRPLEDGESDALVALYREGLDHGHALDGVRMIFEAVLQSPWFLYLVEEGEEVDGVDGAYRLNDFELASRLSYMAWRTAPDDALWEAASEGRLSTPAEIALEAERLFADERARDTVEDFTRQWLGLGDLDSLTRDLDLFPAFTEDVREAMKAETRIFLDEMIWSREATLGEMLEADESWVSADLAPLYGIDVSSSEPVLVSLPAERAGLLTQPGMLALGAHADQTSPIERGLLVLERFLCVELEVPSDLDITIPETDPDLTTAERFEQHTADPACQGCHGLIDPIGLSFENFDPIGQVRTTENGHDIDASGGVPSLGVEDGELWGGGDVGPALANAETVDQCFATQWLRYGVGRWDGEMDAGSKDALVEAMHSGGVRAMLIALTETDAFRYRYAME